MPNYYDGTKLLSLKDINGNTPELYLCVTNRTAGKTTYFGRFLVNKYLNHLYHIDYFYHMLDDCFHIVHQALLMYDNVY